MNHLTILCEFLKEQPQIGELQKQLKEFNNEDWDLLLELSAKHDIQAILYQPLIDLSKEINIPDDVINQLHKVCLSKAARNTFLLNETNQILSAFNDKKVPVICLKGIYLLENIYQNISLRTMGDLDFMVRKEDIPEVFPILKELGFQITSYFDPDDENLDIKHVPPFARKGGIYVEIHWTVLEENEPLSIKPDDLWDRAVPSRIAGVETLALDLEDLILHLAIHFTYQHNLKMGLRGLYDIALVVLKNHNLIDWNELVNRAKKWGAGRIIYLTFYLLEEILSIQIPENTLISLQEELIPSQITTQVRNQLLKNEKVNFVVTPDLSRLSSDSNLRNKVKIIFSRIFLPKQTMARLYSVNPHSLLIYAYYPVRFFQLLRYHANSALRILVGEKQAVESSSKMGSMLALKKWLGNK